MVMVMVTARAAWDDGVSQDEMMAESPLETL